MDSKSFSVLRLYEQHEAENGTLTMEEQNGKFSAKVSLEICDKSWGAKVEIEGSKCSNFVFYGNKTVTQLSVSKKEEATYTYNGKKSVTMVNLVKDSPSTTHVLVFDTAENCMAFVDHLGDQVEAAVAKKSLFDSKIDKGSSQQYFHYYGQLAQQQNMLQDFVRTGTYQRSMLENSVDFVNKIVLDVGAGTGMLSFFALQAGAKKVYAVEASNMAMHAEDLAKANGLSKRLIVVRGKVEEVEIPEQVDIIISEPMGILLVNERMLESFIYARKWLKPGGNMYPCKSDVFVAPFQDDLLFMETTNKANFWNQHSFFGVSLKGASESALDEYFGMPVVDAVDPNFILAKPEKHVVDFLTCTDEDLAEIVIPFDFEMPHPCTIHGLCFWFDVLFNGSVAQIWLSTGPSSPLTHWYQVRCLVQNPVYVGPGQHLTGTVTMKINKRQSYDIHLEMGIDGEVQTTNNINLKDPFYRCVDYSNYQTGASENTYAQTREEENFYE